MSSTYRREMLESEIKKILIEAMRSYRNPKIDTSFLSIVHVSLSKDKRYANIFISSFGKEEAEKKAIVETLNEHRGYFRKAIADRVRLFKAPEITFKEDTGIEASLRIAEILNKIEQEKQNGN